MFCVECPFSLCPLIVFYDGSLYVMKSFSDSSENKHFPPFINALSAPLAAPHFVSGILVRASPSFSLPFLSSIQAPRLQRELPCLLLLHIVCREVSVPWSEVDMDSCLWGKPGFEAAPRLGALLCSSALSGIGLRSSQSPHKPPAHGCSWLSGFLGFIHEITEFQSCKKSGRKAWKVSLIPDLSFC